MYVNAKPFYILRNVEPTYIHILFRFQLHIPFGNFFSSLSLSSPHQSPSFFPNRDTIISWAAKLWFYKIVPPGNTGDFSVYPVIWGILAAGSTRRNKNAAKERPWSLERPASGTALNDNKTNRDFLVRTFLQHLADHSALRLCPVAFRGVSTHKKL